jgi:acyl dehydratase
MPTDNPAGPDPVPTNTIGHRTIARSFELTPRRIQAYAASIHDGNPLYFDDARDGGLVGHPGLAFSFQWNSRHTPDLPPNPRIAPFGVHAWTDLRLRRPFREGDIITSQGETIGIEQIKPGVLTLGRYDMTDSRGDTVAELDYAGIIRGAKIEGAAHPAPERFPVPQPTSGLGSPLWQREVRIGPEAAQVYTECADIYNPIHTERRVALAAGLPDIILHGSATQAIAMTAIVNASLDGDSRGITRFYCQNRAMVLLDSTITVRCHEDRTTAAGAREIFFDVLTQEGTSALANGVLIRA